MKLNHYFMLLYKNHFYLPIFCLNGRKNDEDEEALLNIIET